MGLNHLMDAMRYAMISIHPSRVGWDQALIENAMGYDAFQSTHPVWDGTLEDYQEACDDAKFQSTHPVWDGTTTVSFII